MTRSELMGKVLFLADRKELVKQAKDAFYKYIENTTTVSYTHLDVYKRQPLGKFIKEYSERNKGNEDIPVYRDVYKRQVLYKPLWLGMEELPQGS